MMNKTLLESYQHKFKNKHKKKIQKTHKKCYIASNTKQYFIKALSSTLKINPASFSSFINFKMLDEN